MNSQRKACHRIRRGYTLAELLVASASASVLLVGIGSTLYVASQSLDESASPMRRETQASEVLADLMVDLKLALNFSERTPTALTFTVPDRDGDGLSETIRYAWSGTAGDPLTYAYNNSSPTNLADNVQNLNFTAITREMLAPVAAPSEGGADILFVSGGQRTYMFLQGYSVTPTEAELARITLMKSWGYTVEIISSVESQNKFDDCLDKASVVFVSAEASAAEVGNKLQNARIGVVNENPLLIDELGMAEATTSTSSNILIFNDTTHYITSEFGVSAIMGFTLSQPVTSVSGVVSPDLSSLGYWLSFIILNPEDPLLAPLALEPDPIAPGGSTGSLVVLEAGDRTYKGETVAGRRAQLPWGEGVDITQLTDDGEMLFCRTIAWGAGAGTPELATLLHVVEDSSSLTDEEAAYKALFESWNYEVLAIDED
ncbi:MAG: hypothetical protein KDA42_18145, partial [Planctomycetales bacterium]|nr:hypothetical protein [Planctomycetales bacterium]